MAEKHAKNLQYWEKANELEWSTPEDGHKRQKLGGKGKRDRRCQELLRGCEINWNGGRRRSVGSWISGVSPGCSRVGSVVGGKGNGLSREVTREDVDEDEGPLGEADAVVEVGA